jgi:hypothetical protein
MACSPLFSRPGAVLMSAHDGGIDHHVFVVMVACQQFENAPKDTAFGPAPVTLVDDLPITEPRRQITPRYTGLVALRHCIHKQPVICCRPTHMTLPARQKILAPLPLVVA